MTPQEFVSKWANTRLGEQQSYQLHFNDVCELVGHAKPGSSEHTTDGEYFHFQRLTRKIRGENGFADVYYENHFAIEYKKPRKYKNLDRAFEQLQQYQRQLNNPPLLIVTDIESWRIHTNFTSTTPNVFEFSNHEISTKPEVFRWLQDIFFNPQVFNPARNTHVVTRETANALKAVADDMRLKYGVRPERAARFLTRIIFSLFAEDIGLLPSVVQGKGIFTYIVEQNRGNSKNFEFDIQALFKQMEDGGRLHSLDIKWFNGALFRNVQTHRLSIRAIVSLENACRHDWRYVEPAIFGTLFERCLDPAKRAQLGAHYTSPEDILLIVEPVLMQPLRREWAVAKEKAHPVRERFLNARNVRGEETIKTELLAIRDEMLDRLRSTTVLDPACGSGNFLYIALQQMMDLELDIINDPLWDDLDRAALGVSPAQLYGIEKDEIAHALASIVVWIGYIKWREDHGFRYDEKPLLSDLSQNIVCKDAILAFDAEGNPIEPDWPAVDVIIGNPPFLGGKKQRRELGDNYIERLLTQFPQIHGEADFSTYWFEKSRQQIETSKAKRVGLLSTNSIRGIRSRPVLSRIKETGDLFMAWSDREWILDGAAVRISMVGFDDGSESIKTLDGVNVQSINPDLTGLIDISAALPLAENKGIAFMGLSPTGDFPISNELAQKMLNAEPKNNAVLRRYISGKDITSRDRAKWIVDFTGLDFDQAQKYEWPMQYVLQSVKPYRDKHKNTKLRANWWLFEATRTGMVAALRGKSRQLMTSLTAKHRFFVWYPSEARAANSVVAIARDDDYMFGVLHSRLHIVWALRKSGWLGKGNDPRYTNTTTFETFPFPWSPGQEDKSHPAHAAISRAAKQLHAERQAWLNPEDVDASKLPPNALGGPRGVKDRTLTNLYNALQVFRGRDSIKTKAAAADFAPRLDALHRALDEAVCDAYGWGYAVLDDEEEILRRLLALNLARAG